MTKKQKFFYFLMGAVATLLIGGFILYQKMQMYCPGIEVWNWSFDNITYCLRAGGGLML